MPLLETAPDALAKVYARALFDAAEKSGSAETVLGQLEHILEMARADQSLSEVLASPLVDAGKRDAFLVTTLGGRVDETTLSFLRLLNRKGRLSHLSPITAALDMLVQERFGRVEIDVFTAAPIAQADLDAIKRRLAEAMGKEVVVHPYTDSAMIGGVKFRMGDQLIDASIRAELNRMRDRMLAQSGSVRARAGEILDRE